jgi:FMN-dependent oxidoreductase (nitrilotriacetate monooxygenase family)
MTQANNPHAATVNTHKKKSLILNVFLHATPSLSAGQWKHPTDKSRDYNTLEFWIELAQIAERGKLNALFFADYLAYYDVYQGPENWKIPASGGYFIPKIAPEQIISAMSAATESLSFGITFSTVSEHPYHFARRLATLDHLTEGRVGWNIVTSYAPAVGRQLLNGAPLPKHDDRYTKSVEYLDVVHELLLSSWRDDAILNDKKSGIFADPEAIREINFDGKFFTVPGPSIVHPSPQRFPLIIQAGTSDKGKQFAAENAELIFINAQDAEKAKVDIKELKRLAKEKFNRDPSTIKVITMATPIVAKTHEEAVEKLALIRKCAFKDGPAIGFGAQSHVDLAQFDWDEPVIVGKTEGGRSVTENMGKKGGVELTKRQIIENGLRVTSLVGDAVEIADWLENFAEDVGIDGFNLIFPVWHESLENFVDLVVPELQRRGIFWEDYEVPGGTFRENVYREKGHTFLPQDHPVNNLRWKAGVSKEEFDDHIDKWRVERQRVRDSDV